MAKNNQVNISINGKDRASRAFKKVERSAGGLGSKLKGMPGKFKKVAGAIAKVGGAILAVGGTIGTGVMYLGKLGSETNSVSLAFGRMTKKMSIDSNSLMETLKKNSKGAIADTNLQLAANKAMALGVGGSVEEMGTLMEIARVKAKTMGISTTQAFDDIVTGLGRGSPMILDNLGITVKLGEANEEYAKKLGKVSSELTSAEQKQALINYVVSRGKQELVEMGDVAIDSKERFAIFQATLENTKATIGEGLLPVFDSVLQVLQPIIEKVSKSIQLWFQNKENVEKLTNAMQIIIKVFGFVFEAIGKVIWFLTKMGEMFGTVAFKIYEFYHVVIDKFTRIKNFVTTSWNNIKTTTINVWNGIKNGIIGIVNSLYEGVVGKFTAMIDKVKAIYNKIKGWLGNIFGAEKKANQAASNIKRVAQTQPSVGTGSTVSGARASGGPVVGGNSYLVGENGPEIFTPQSSGSISNKTNQTFNFNFTGNLGNKGDRRNMIEEIKMALSRDMQFASYGIN